MNWITKNSSDRVLLYTLLAIAVISAYVIVSTYYSQVKIYREKELFKLECIASAVSFKLDGSSHDALVKRYPTAMDQERAAMDSAYQFMQMQLAMARQMNHGITSDMYTVVYDSLNGHARIGVHSEDHRWLMPEKQPVELINHYNEGGILPIHENESGTWLTAFSPLKNDEGNTVGVLRVDERFDSFIDRAQDQIFINIMISVLFMGLIGALMFMSLKNILRRQELLSVQKQEIDDIRRELIANISHDIRTPLSSIQGYLETILIKKDKLDSSQQEKYLSISLKSTKKLNKLVDELFELSKLESTETVVQEEVFSIGELIYDVLNGFRMKANEKSVEINTEIHQDIPLVKGDIAMIDRVLQNLIENSLKFCEPGGKITVITELDKDKVWVHVKDTGIGISVEDLKNIFNRFHHGKHEESGTGLGLAIVKNILDRHKSIIDVSSTLGSGTTFCFTLPCA